MYFYHQFTPGQVVFLFRANVAATADELLLIFLQIVHGSFIGRYQVVARQALNRYITEAYMQLHYFFARTDVFAVRYIGVENQHIAFFHAVRYTIDGIGTASGHHINHCDKIMGMDFGHMVFFISALESEIYVRIETFRFNAKNTHRSSNL